MVLSRGMCLENFEEDAMDRKILVALVAKKLWLLVDNLANENQEAIQLVLGDDSRRFHEYMLDVMAEACQLIKDKRGTK